MRQWFIRLATIGVALLFLTRNAHAQCMSGTSSSGTVFKTTGDPSLDMAINGEASMLASTFGATPTLYTFNDSQSSNAFADCANNRMMIGLRLLREELWNMDHGPLAVAGIMAHEFTHIYQCKHNSSLDGKNRELQADYMAGWYLKHKKSVGELDISGFASSLWSKGDYQFTSPQHHGTPAQRVAAMKAGFEDSASSTSTAYANSIEYLTDGDSPPLLPQPKTCERHVPCTHIVPCQHQIPCQHPVPVTHQIPCQHVVSCQHIVMTPYGPRPMHQFDVPHPFDVVTDVEPAHQFDLAHPAGDQLHPYDTETYTCSSQ